MVTRAKVMTIPTIDKEIARPASNAIVPYGLQDI